MSIGTTIKKLRRERDITQEQLAEYIGITSRAISQWECDRTAPDISQLPALANIFEVSADQLLGIDVDNKEKRIQSLFNEADDISCHGDKRNR
jgi:transcriptional regulator with XRE-family HTH domain